MIYLYFHLFQKTLIVLINLKMLYYFSLYQPSTAFISYAINSYPQKLIFELFEEVKNKNILSMLNEETKDLDSKGRQELKQIIETNN